MMTTRIPAMTPTMRAIGGPDLGMEEVEEEEVDAFDIVVGDICGEGCCCCCTSVGIGEVGSGIIVVEAMGIGDGKGVTGGC